MKNSINFLIVDDDADDRMLFIEAAREVDETIECRIAKNGEEALNLLRNIENRLPDFIFLDIRMPRMSGKKCLFEIKNDERLKGIPVIIYTTSKVVEESKELRDMGAFHFMTKPKNADEIFYLISFVVDEQASASRRNKLS
jgi:DNA-binding NtrC family response regulator